MSRYADRFTALLDACVLGGALRRNMLLSLAEAGLFRPRWSSRILDETQKAITQITKGETDGSRQRAKPMVPGKGRQSKRPSPKLW